MYELAQELFPICRSITGNGVRETFHILKREIPELEIYEIASGTEVFDWTIPPEWNIRETYIEDAEGKRIIDFRDNNLHVVGYSTSVDRYVELEELKENIYFEESDPNAIPYVTSYYKERYGFCMSKEQLDGLSEGTYHMYIDSDLDKHGSMTYGEVIFPGETGEEILFSVNICHPSMANNELSGPVVMTELCKYIREMKKRKYTYRIVFLPETIGSICYLSRHLEHLKSHVKAGFVVTCVGDDRTYSYLESAYGDTLADRVLTNVLQFHYPQYRKYSFLERGSDERQYNAPGVNLPVCTFCRSKFGEFPEYHTSKDNMNLISEEGLRGAYIVLSQVIDALELNDKYRVNCICEPQLGRRGLYPTVSKKNNYGEAEAILNFVAYANGINDLIDISNTIKVPIDKLKPIVEKLERKELIERVK